MCVAEENLKKGGTLLDAPSGYSVSALTLASSPRKTASPWMKFQRVLPSSAGGGSGPTSTRVYPQPKRAKGPITAVSSFLPSSLLGGVDGAAFNKKLNSLTRYFKTCVHRAKWRGMIFTKGLVALIAAEALKAVSVFPEFLAAGLAIMAGHCEPLAFLRGLAHNAACEGSLRAIAVSSAPLSVPAESGAYCLLPTESGKSKRSAGLTSSDHCTINKPPQNSVYERQRVLNSLESVPPSLEPISNLRSCQLLACRIAVECSQNKVCPGHLGLNLLSNSVLKSNSRTSELNDLNIQFISLLGLLSNLCIHFLQGFLKNLFHVFASVLYDEIIRYGVTSCQEIF